MPFLMIAGERYALSAGDTTLGGDSDDVLRASPLAALEPFAIITSDDDASAIRSTGASRGALLNGRPLDETPCTLRHGDQLVVGSLVIHVGDLRAAGRTARGAGVTDDQLAESASISGANPTASTGGQLTAVADGVVHLIRDAGIVLGRDPDCDVILESREVSRRHATIQPGLLGYTLKDESTNGVFVNGERIERVHLLSQGDVMRVGDLIFRFTADSPSYEPDASVWSAPAVPLAEAIAPRPVEESPPTAPTPKQARIAQPAPAPVLATLEVIAGRIPIGMRFPLERPVAQLGRGTASDVCLVDDSVSGAHATLMLRGSTWHLIDHGSRNGTYVDDQRISECVLRGPCELRLGGVTLYFQPVQSAVQPAIGTLGLIGLTDEQVDGRRRR